MSGNNAKRMMMAIAVVGFAVPTLGDVRPDFTRKRHSAPPPTADKWGALEQRLSQYKARFEAMDEAMSYAQPAMPSAAARVATGTDMGPRLSSRLSGAALNLWQLARGWPKVANQVKKAVESAGMSALSSLAPTQVSTPAYDVAFSKFAWFTQSETSTAWCGQNAVIGYNDSGSFQEQLFVSPSFSFSLNGRAMSTNQGALFTDMGFLPSDPVPSGSIYYDLAGDPVVQCTDKSTFYYASLATNSADTDSDGVVDTVFSDISVSKSTNGGSSFAGPVPAASKDGFTHFLDKPWLAAVPGSNSLYVTYTDFDSSGTSAACRTDVRTAVELVRSTDGGQTWSAPLVIAEVCGLTPFVQGSQVVSHGNEVYVAWEDFPDFFNRSLQIRRSIDGGLSFGPPVTVDEVVPVGDGSLLQGAFRAPAELPSLAIDRDTGALYIAWADGRNLSVPDLGVQTYRYADVLASSSTDGGVTWSAPVRVNDSAEPLVLGYPPLLLGTDQYQPAIAVYNNGTTTTTATIATCFYDRRNDNNNFLIDQFCAESTNGGATWINRRVTSASWPPVPGQDFVINPVYMGDYDTLATDATGTAAGFVHAWGDNRRGNPDVEAEKF